MGIEKEMQYMLKGKENKHLMFLLCVTEIYASRDQIDFSSSSLWYHQFITRYRLSQYLHLLLDQSSLFVQNSQPEISQSSLLVAIQANGVVTCNIPSDEGFLIQRRVLLGQQLLDWAIHSRRSRVEMSAEKARDRNSRFSILCYHSMLDAAELVVRDQLKMPINSMEKKSVKKTLKNVFKYVCVQLMPG